MLWLVIWRGKEIAAYLHEEAAFERILYSYLQGAEVALIA